MLIQKLLFDLKYTYRARYYDPQVGRFLQRDPLGFGGGDVNLYNYVGGNPVNLVDQLGLSVEPKQPVLPKPSEIPTEPNIKVVDCKCPEPGAGESFQYYVIIKKGTGVTCTCYYKDCNNNTSTKEGRLVTEVH